jgi:alkanesulfonate monooxygenase SsuD/methylene tetrahydromethanopterin reductase-like flavin-dependent oxidoreductase (luciferase family)
MSVDFGLLLPTRELVMSGTPDVAPMLALAEHAEGAGFAAAWIGDSLTARPRHEPLTLLAAVAARTRRMKLGTAVLLPALRPPVVLAHVIGTLDRIADGRVILGVGIAADNPAIRNEFAAAGVPFERRVGRFVEILEICRALWSQDHVSFHGKHFTLDDVTMEPKPARPGADLDRRQRTHGAARIRPVRCVVSHRADGGLLRRRVSQDPGRGPGCRASRRCGERGGVRHACAGP